MITPFAMTPERCTVPLTKADKLWLARTVRRILAEVVADEAKQLGGYDGATDTDEGDYEQGKRKKPPRIGFSL